MSKNYLREKALKVDNHAVYFFTGWSIFIELARKHTMSFILWQAKHVCLQV